MPLFDPDPCDLLEHAVRRVSRDDLVEALTRIKVRPVNGKVVAEWMADAILEALDDIAGEVPVE